MREPSPSELVPACTRAAAARSVAARHLVPVAATTLVGLGVLALVAGLLTGRAHAQPPRQPGPAATQVLLPVMDNLGEDTSCASLVSVQNVGDEPAQAAVLAWPSPNPDQPDACRAPFAVACTGVIQPGSAWHFDRASLPTGAHSAIAFSFSTRLLSDLGVTRETDTTAADALCAALAAPTFLGNCGAYARFKAAFDDGSRYEGIAMDEATGGAIAVHILRDCPGDATAGVRMTSAYQGVGANAYGEFDAEAGGYRYYVPRLANDPQQYRGVIYAQNGGSEATTVELWTQPENVCRDGTLAATFSVDPGASLVLPAEGHVGAGWRGRAWLRSPEPLGVIADEYGLDMLATYPGPARVVKYDAAGHRLPDLARRAAFGPLIPDARYGWDVEIEVLNLETDRIADVEIEFLDAGGRRIDVQSRLICARGSATFSRDMSDDLRGETVGSVRVVSRPEPIAPATEAAAISATAFLTEWNDPSRGKPLQRMAYPLASEIAALDDPAQGDNAEGAAGTRILAVPAVYKDLDWRWRGGLGVTSELSVANAVRQQGWTDVAVLLFDQNAFIDTVCRRLDAGEVEYIDLQIMGAQPNGFVSSALVSATYWEHGDAGPGVARTRDPNAVGLSAALVTRSRTRLGQDVYGDETAATTGLPLRALPGDLSERIGDPCHPSPFDAPPMPLPPSMPHLAAAESQAFIPAMTYIGADARCTADVEVTNDGPAPTKFLLMTWGETTSCPPGCQPPAVTCSGLIAPGQSWRFSQDDLADNRALGAIAYSLSTQTLGEIGVEPGSDELVADRLCSLLAAGADTPSSCEHVSFRRAYDRGLVYSDLPLDRAVGTPIRATVVRGCPDVETAGQRNESQYDSPAGASVFAPDPVDGTYWYAVSTVYADYRDHNSLVYAQNAGTECASVTLRHRHSGDCLRAREGRVISLAPGETTYVDANDYVGPQFRGFLELHADQPLAIVSDMVAPDVQLSFAATSGQSPFDVDGDGVVDERDLAAMDAAYGSTPVDPDWNARADLFPNGAVDENDQSYLERNLCGRAAPDIPDPPAPAARPADQVALPALDRLGPDDACESWFAVQNVGEAEAKAAVLAWGAPALDPQTCAGPVAVECTGLLRPGRTWHVATGQLGAGLASAMVFSFNTRTLDDIGVEPGSDKTVADHMCDLLWYHVLGDCVAYDRFKAAFDEGLSFAGVPLDQATGAGLAAQVERRCPGDEMATNTAATTYAGVGANAFGVRDEAWGGYVYAVPLVYSDRASFNSTVVAQNAGSLPADVTIEMRAQDDCGPMLGTLCLPLVIDPGERVEFDPTTCVGPNWQGRAQITSSEPLAILVASAGRDTRFNYLGVPVQQHLDATGRQLLDADRFVLRGPLTFDAEQGWDVGVQVGNLSTTRTARVRVSFRDPLGAAISTLDDWICPGGSQTFFLPVVNSLDLATPRVGTVRVESVRLPSALDIPPAPIAGLVTMLRYTYHTRAHTLAADAYNLTPKTAGFDHPIGSGAGGLDSGIGVVAIPDVRLDADGAGTGAKLAVANLVGAPGWTDYAVLVYDQNHLLDVFCRQVDAQETEYIDMAAFGLLPGFRGAAVISAVRWTHEAVDWETGSMRPLVGLSAALVVQDELGSKPDPLGSASGAPLRALPWPAGRDVGNLCVDPWTPDPTATPAPTRTPGPSRTPGPTRTPRPSRTPPSTATAVAPTFTASPTGPTPQRPTPGHGRGLALPILTK